jgi:hypothetical protein
MKDISKTEWFDSSVNGKKTEWFQCICHEDEHTLKFSLLDLPEEKNIEFFATIYLNNEFSTVHGLDWLPGPIFRLLDWALFVPARKFWVCVKYFFGYKCKYGHWDVWQLQPEEVDKMIEMLKAFKEKKAEYENASKKISS